MGIFIGLYSSSDGNRSNLLPIATIAFTKQTQSYLHHIREDIMQHYYNSGNDEKVSEMQNQLTGNLKC